jgi:FAD/FMN-containing dehydrogenase
VFAMDTLPILWKSAEPAFEEARVDRVFNLRRPNRYPLAVVKASEEAHVVEAVKLAIEKGCRISVRSGGHSWAVSSVRDNAILVDLGNYHEMSLDEETGIARVSASTTSGDINAFLLAKGRMFAGGHCPDVALGGFLLQGGVGWNARV